MRDDDGDDSNWMSNLVVELVIGFHDVAFLPPELVLPPHFLIVVVAVMASGLPHALRLWLGVSKGMFPVKYFAPTKPLCVSSIS